MAHLFYLLGAFFMLHEISILGNPKSYLKKLRSLKKADDNDEGFDTGRHIVKDSFGSMSEEQKNVIRLAFFSLFYFAWLVIGCCFAGQWLGFLALMTFGLLIGFIRRKSDNNTNLSLSIIRFDAFISALSLAFLIINHFHHII